jgi:hypothetical protein
LITAGTEEIRMKSLGVVFGVIALIVAPVALPSWSGAQTPPQTPPKSPVQPPSKTPAPAKAPAKTPPKAPAPAKAETPPPPPAPTRPSLAELRRDVETRKTGVVRLQEMPLPGDDEMKKHREAKATLEETLAPHEARIQLTESKLPGWRKERGDLKAMAKPTRTQTARIQELDVVIAEAERVLGEARNATAGVKTQLREVDGEIAKVESRRVGARRAQETAERALKQSEDARATEQKRVETYLALYDLTVRARAFDAAMKTPKPPFEKARYEETTSAKLADQVTQERKAIENGRYTYDTNGIRKQLQTDGTKFFQTAKQTASKKPIPGPAAKATPIRTKTVKDIDAMQKVWTQALGKPGLPEPNDLAPLVDRVQTALWDMK